MPLLSKFIQVILLVLSGIRDFRFSDANCALQLDVISVLFFCKKSLLARHAFALFERTTSLLASKRSERDTYRGNTIENRGCQFIYWRASEASETLSGVTHSRFRYIYWRASVASETLTGVKMKKSGMFICIYVWTYVCHFVL